MKTYKREFLFVHEKKLADHGGDELERKPRDFKGRNGIVPN